MKKFTYNETQILLERLSFCKGNWYPKEHQIVLIGNLCNYIYIPSKNKLCKNSLEQIINEIRLQTVLEIRENEGMYDVKYLDKDGILKEENK